MILKDIAKSWKGCNCPFCYVNTYKGLYKKIVRRSSRRRLNEWLRSGGEEIIRNASKEAKEYTDKILEDRKVSKEQLEEVFDI